MLRHLLTLLLVVVAAPAFAAVDGAEIYARSCSGCHGANGKGGRAPPIAGKPAPAVSAMVNSHIPPMTNVSLSPEELGAVAKYLAGMKK